MEKFDAIIKYLNLAWGVIVVVALVVFFAAGEWGKWVNIRDNWEKITKIIQEIFENEKKSTISSNKKKISF